MNITTTKWTCDRCRGEHEAVEREQPKGWQGVLRISPPLAEAQGARVHLCAECADALQSWLTEVIRAEAKGRRP